MAYSGQPLQGKKISELISDVNQEDSRNQLPIRQSRRNRQKSGKSHLNPDFIYDDFTEERQRSASWSSSTRAVVVERNVNGKIC